MTVEVMQGGNGHAEALLPLLFAVHGRTGLLMHCKTLRLLNLAARK